MVDKKFCDVCGVQVERMRDGSFTVYTDDPNSQNKSGWKIVHYDLCQDHALLVNVFIESLVQKEEGLVD